MMANDQRTIFCWQLGIVFCSSSMFILVSTLPMFVGALVKHYDLSQSAAALLIGGELGIMALSAAMLARNITVINRRLAAAIGLIISIMANVSMFFVDTLPFVILARGVAGLGCGVAYACGYSSLANLPRPSLTMMLTGIVVLSATVVMFAVEIPLTEVIGRAAPFGMLAIVALVALTTTPFLPRSANADLIDDATDAMVMSQHLPLLISYVCCLVAASMVITFAERIGVSLNLPPEQINYALAGSAVATIIGPALIVLLGDRMNYRQYISIAIIVSTISALLLVLGNSFFHFVCGVSAAAFASATGQLAYNDLGARSDRTGRMSAIMSSLTAISFALNPLIGGAAVGLGGMILVMISALVILAVSITLLFARPAVSF